jgi:predicted GNAT family N-acyltransferase
MGIVLKKQLIGLNIVELRKELCTLISKEASIALNGDPNAGCSIKNVKTSCFAAECCDNKELPKMKIEDMTNRKHAFVAICDRESDGKACVGGKCHFVGCVSADSVTDMHRGMFPQINKECLILSNLCVAEAYRKFGVGRKLISKITSLTEESVFLLVAHKSTNVVSDPEFEIAFKDRVTRLKKIYANLSFVVYGENISAILFKYVG